MSASDDLENKILDHILGGGDYTRPATVYVSLHTGDPGETGANSEVSGNNYSRKAVTNNGTNWPSASSGAKANGAAVTFDTPSATWGTVSHFAIWDAATDGNCMFIGALTASKVINSGDTVSFAIGDIDLTME